MSSPQYARDMPSGFTNRVERVAIIGSGGNMGSRIVAELQKTGPRTITGITRPGSTSKLPEGVKSAVVDYTSGDIAALADALRGQQFLLVTLSIGAPRDAIINIVKAAIKAEVPYVLPNWFGHDPNKDAFVKDSMLDTFRDSLRKEFEGQDATAYFLLACGFWYEFSLGGGTERFGFDFKNRQLIWFEDGSVEQSVSTWAQCARAVAGLVNLKLLPDDENDTSATLSGLRNQALYVKSFTLSQKTMFDSVKRVTGTGDTDWTMTHESSRQRWEEASAEVKKGNLGEFVKMLYSRTFFPPGDGVSDAKHNHVLGLEDEPLDEYTAVAVEMGERDAWASYRH